MGGGDTMCITPPYLYPPSGMGYTPPTLRGIPPPSRQNVRFGGIIPSIARIKFLGKNRPIWSIYYKLIYNEKNNKIE